MSELKKKKIKGNQIISDDKLLEVFYSLSDSELEDSSSNDDDSEFELQSCPSIETSRNLTADNIQNEDINELDPELATALKNFDQDCSNANKDNSVPSTSAGNSAPANAKPNVLVSKKRLKQKQKKPAAKKAKKTEDNNWEEFTDPCIIPLPVFSETIGPQCSLDKSASALEFFQLYFTDDIMRSIKIETNRYANSSITALRRQNKVSPRSMWQNWTIVKLNDVYGFLAFILHMCLVRKPKLFDYWSKNVIIATLFDRSIMPRDRFKSILSMWHLNNNEQYISKGNHGYDPLFKIKPFFDHFLKVSQENFFPGENLCVNETICPFRGRISFRVYMKDKPEKYGIKIYALTNAVTGFILNADVYTGQLVTEKVNTVQGIFDRLCEIYYQKRHTVYMDRFYTSPNLLDYLYKQSTLGVGTVRNNRKNMPKDLVRKHLERDKITYRRDGSKLCIKWHDKRDVYILSSKHQFKVSVINVKSKRGMIKKNQTHLCFRLQHV